MTINHKMLFYKYINSAFLKPWVAKACKLPHIKEKGLRTQDFKSEDPFLKEHYDITTKIKKLESDSRQRPFFFFWRSLRFSAENQEIEISLYS